MRRLPYRRHEGVHGPLTPVSGNERITFQAHRAAFKLHDTFLDSGRPKSTAAPSQRRATLTRTRIQKLGTLRHVPDWGSGRQKFMKKNANRLLGLSLRTCYTYIPGMHTSRHSHTTAFPPPPRLVLSLAYSPNRPFIR